MSDLVLTNSNDLVSSNNFDWWENIENFENDVLFKNFMINSTNYINMIPLPYFLEFKLVNKNVYKAVLYLKSQSYGNRYVIGDSFWDIYMGNDGNILYIERIIVDEKHIVLNRTEYTMKTVFGNKKNIVDKITYILNDCQIKSLSSFSISANGHH